MSDFVAVTVDCPEDCQRTSFENGTLQGIGPRHAVTIQTQLALPAEMENCSQAELATYLREVLTKASNATGNSLVFDVQLGQSADAQVATW